MLFSEYVDLLLHEVLSDAHVKFSVGCPGCLLDDVFVHGIVWSKPVFLFECLFVCLVSLGSLLLVFTSFDGCVNQYVKFSGGLYVLCVLVYEAVEVSSGEAGQLECVCLDGCGVVLSSNSLR